MQRSMMMLQAEALKRDQIHTPRYMPGDVLWCAAHSCGLVWIAFDRANDPSAGSPTETLLRLLLPLSVAIHKSSYSSCQKPETAAVQIVHRSTQSVGATGGVYKGQGHNQHELMTRAY